jgi:hypothetical protein
VKLSDILFLGILAYILLMAILCSDTLQKKPWYVAPAIPAFVLLVYLDRKEKRKPLPKVEVCIEIKDLTPKKPIRYALHPGYVPNREADGRVWISFSQLCELYGIAPCDCVRWDSKHPNTYFGKNSEDYIHLFPRPKGDYKKIGCYEVPSNNKL